MNSLKALSITGVVFTYLLTSFIAPVFANTIDMNDSSTFTCGSENVFRDSFSNDDFFTKYNSGGDAVFSDSTGSLTIDNTATGNWGGFAPKEGTVAIDFFDKEFSKAKVNLGDVANNATSTKLINVKFSRNTTAPNTDFDYILSLRSSVGENKTTVKMETSSDIHGTSNVADPNFEEEFLGVNNFANAEIHLWRETDIENQETSIYSYVTSPNFTSSIGVFKYDDSSVDVANVYSDLKLNIEIFGDDHFVVDSLELTSGTKCALEADILKKIDSHVYRFWSDAYKKHFYTSSQAERDTILRDNPNWRYEGAVFSASKSKDGVCQTGLNPVYRFWSDSYSGHFYTMSKSEKEYIEANDPNWAYESVAYCVAPENFETTKPMYRFWSDTYKGHFYTTSKSEKEYIEANDSNWKYEMIAFYVK